MRHKQHTNLPIVCPESLNVTEHFVDIVHLQHYHVPEALQIVAGSWELLARRLVEIAVAQACRQTREEERELHTKSYKKCPSGFTFKLRDLLSGE